MGELNGCKPPVESVLKQFPNASLTSWTEWPIASGSCKGPNNCLSEELKGRLVVIFLVHIIVNLLFVRVALENVVPWCRKLKEMKWKSPQLLAAPRSVSSELSESVPA